MARDREKKNCYWLFKKRSERKRRFFPLQIPLKLDCLFLYCLGGLFSLSLKKRRRLQSSAKWEIYISLEKRLVSGSRILHHVRQTNELSFSLFFLSTRKYSLNYLPGRVLPSTLFERINARRIVLRPKEKTKCAQRERERNKSLQLWG